MGEIFETMRKLMNFTYSAFPSTDGFYGAKVMLKGGQKATYLTSWFSKSGFLLAIGSPITSKLDPFLFY
jgi:hypothetical protein